MNNELSGVYEPEDLKKYSEVFNKYYQEFKELGKSESLSGVSSAFDYEKGIHKEENVFKSSNWNDPILNPLRNLIQEISYKGDYQNGFSTLDKGEVQLCYVWENDYNYTLISGAIFGKVIYVGYYKNRGRTEHLKYLDTGQDLTAYDLLEVYDNLGILDS